LMVVYNTSPLAFGVVVTSVVLVISPYGRHYQHSLGGWCSGNRRRL